jgi:hypothetical protein
MNKRKNLKKKKLKKNKKRSLCQTALSPSGEKEAKNYAKYLMSQ